jgi:hypothetical protein
MAANQPARGDGRTLKPAEAAIFRHEQEISSANEQRIAGMGHPARAYNVNKLFNLYYSSSSLAQFWSVFLRLAGRFLLTGFLSDQLLIDW